MPAAAVIPAPTAYTNVVAVKKLVVRIVFRADGSTGSVPLHTDALAEHPAGGGSGAARRARPSLVDSGRSSGPSPVSAVRPHPAALERADQARPAGVLRDRCPGSRSAFPTAALAASARESGPDRAYRRRGEGLPRPARPGDRPPIFPPRCSSSSVAAGRHTYLEQIRVLIARRSKNVRKGVARIQVHGITEYDLGSGVSSVHRARRRPGSVGHPPRAGTGV